MTNLTYHAQQRCWLSALSRASGLKRTARRYLDDATMILHARRGDAGGAAAWETGVRLSFTS